MSQKFQRNLAEVLESLKVEKVEPGAKILVEENFSFQRTFSKFVSEHDIPLNLVLNLDQNSLSYVSPQVNFHLIWKVQPQFPSKVLMTNNK